MSMTREEKIKRLKALKARCERLIASSDRGPEEWRKDAEALDLALAALRGPTREMVEEVWRGCYTCDEYKYFMFNAWTNPESSERHPCFVRNAANR